jgi:hypothetical protein
VRRISGDAVQIDATSMPTSLTYNLHYALSPAKTLPFPVKCFVQFRRAHVPAGGVATKEEFSRLDDLVGLVISAWN